MSWAEASSEMKTKHPTRKKGCGRKIQETNRKYKMPRYCHYVLCLSPKLFFYTKIKGSLRALKFMAAQNFPLNFKFKLKFAPRKNSNLTPYFIFLHTCVFVI